MVSAVRRSDPAVMTTFAVPALILNKPKTDPVGSFYQVFATLARFMLKMRKSSFFE